MRPYDAPGLLKFLLAVQNPYPDLVLPLSRGDTCWTLGRDDEGMFITFDGGLVARLDSPGFILMVAWRLGMPGPQNADDADKILAEKEAAEVAAIDFLQDKVGQRGPQA